MKSACFFGAIGLLAALPAAAQLNTTSLSLYSNGAVYRTIEGSLPVTGGRARFELPANILNGTFWLYKDGRLVTNATSRLDTISRPVEAGNLHELIKANLGKAMTLQYGTAGKTVSGQALRLLTSSGGSVLLIKEKGSNSTSAIRLIDIVSAQIEGNLATSAQRDTIINVLSIPADGNSAKVSARLFQKGMSWHPSYYLIFDDNGKSHLAAKATITNDIIEGKAVPVKIILGEPQLSYGLELDPLFREGEIIQPQAPEMAQRRYHVQTMKIAEGAQSDQVRFVPPPLEYDEVQDYLVLDAGKLDLIKGQHHLAPLYDKDIATTDVYKADIHAHQWYYHSPSTGEYPIPVTHLIRFENSTDYPLINAPVMVTTKDGTPLGQLSMPRTAKGAKAELALNVNTGAEVKYKFLVKNQKEVRRNSEGVLFKADGEGQVELANRFDRAIELEVSLMVAGKVEDKGGASHEVLSNDPSWGVPFAQNRLVWKISLKKGEKRSLRFTYQTYSRG